MKEKAGKMRFRIRAKPNAKEDSVEKIDEANFVILVKEPPIRGRANAAIIKLLADYFGVPAAQVSIVAGFASKHKIVEIVSNGGPLLKRADFGL